MPAMTMPKIWEWMCYRLALCWPGPWQIPDWVVAGAMDYIDDIMHEPDKLARELLKLKSRRTRK